MQMQRSIAKLPQGVVDTEAVDLLPVFLHLFCDSEWLLHVHPAVITFFFSVVHHMHVSLTFCFLPHLTSPSKL